MSYQTIIVKNMPELIQHMLNFSGGPGEVWYRGHKFHDYHVEPSAYRYDMFKHESKKLEQRAIYDARSSMLHIAETQRLKHDLDWLCYLQHNGVPTRLLDWTFEFQVALYFAFEDYVKNKAKAGSMPCLWAFKPAKFMEAMYDYMYTGNSLFSLGSNDLQIVADDVFDDKQPKDVTFISEYEDMAKPSLDDVYIPFFSSFVNERARLQGSCFIRFPLLNRVSDPRVYDDHRLEEFVTKDSRFSNCLAKFIFIHPSSMKNELSMLNLKTSRIYPEVENIALGIKRRLFEP